MIAILLLTVLVILIVRNITFWQAADLGTIYKETPVYFGHRGDKNNFPENTIESYRSAINKGLLAIELDVMSTKDNQLVCSHNFDLTRETTGTGFINKTDYKDLTKIKAGNQFPESERAAMPLLTDVIAALPEHIILNIEIKTKSTFDLKSTILVARLIKSGHIPQKVIISSFNPLAVRIVKMISKSIPTGYIYNKKKNFKGVFVARSDCLHPKIGLINDRSIKFCRNRNMRINTCTVNKVETVKRLINQNIEAIITDNP